MPQQRSGLAPQLTGEYLSRQTTDGIQKLAADLGLSRNARPETCIARIERRNQEKDYLDDWTRDRLQDSLTCRIAELDKAQLLELALGQKSSIYEVVRAKDRGRLREYLSETCRDGDGGHDRSAEAHFHDQTSSSGDPNRSNCSGTRADRTLNDSPDVAETAATIEVCEDACGKPFDRLYMKMGGRYQEAIRVQMLKMSHHGWTTYSTLVLEGRIGLRTRKRTQISHKTWDEALQSFFVLNSKLITPDWQMIGLPVVDATSCTAEAPSTLVKMEIDRFALDFGDGRSL